MIIKEYFSKKWIKLLLNTPSLSSCRRILMKNRELKDLDYEEITSKKRTGKRFLEKILKFFNDGGKIIHGENK